MHEDLPTMDGLLALLPERDLDQHEPLNELREGPGQEPLSLQCVRRSRGPAAASGHQGSSRAPGLSNRIS